MTKIKIALGAVALLVIGFALGVYGDRASNSQSLGRSAYDPLYQVADLYQGSNQTLIARGGYLVGPLLQTVASYINVLSNVVTNNLTQGSGGFTGNFTTSTTLTPAQFCGTTNERWLNTSAAATGTLPAATSSWVACGSPAGFGGWQNQWITNDSTNTVTIVAGAGTKFLCETNGVGTTTIIGGCTASTVSINASSAVQTSGFWDGASSSLYIMWGNMFH